MHPHSARALCALSLGLLTPWLPQVTSAQANAPAPKLERVLLLGDSPVQTGQVAPYYRALLGQAADATLLDKLRMAVAQAHDEAGWGLVSVDAPRLMGGTAVVRVQPLLLTKVEVLSGEPPAPVADLDASRVLPALQTGKALNLNLVDEQLRLAQWQPHRRWEIDFQADDHAAKRANTVPTAAPAFAPTPGSGLAEGMSAPVQPQAAPRVPRGARNQANGLIARVLVNETSPWFGRLIVDNAGQEATGRERVRLQVGHGDLFGPGRSLDLTALVSVTQPERQQQLALRYQHPVPQWATLITAEATQSHSRTGVVSDFFDISGRSRGWSLSAKRVLPRSGALEPHVELGIEPSVHDDVVDFFGTNLGHTVGVAPLALSAGGTWQSGPWRAYGQVRWRHNNGWGPSASAAQYQEARVGAKPQWDTVDTAVDVRVNTGAGREGVLRLQGQLSPNALVSPAQFRVGGSQAMRGLQEGELGGDSGLALSLEHWWTPLTDHRFGAFVDAARALRRQALANEANALGAASVGVGWQWQIVRGWQLNTTVAHVVSAHSLNTTERGDARLHMALDGSF